jgi:hypothetical protein
MGSSTRRFKTRFEEGNGQGIKEEEGDLHREEGAVMAAQAQQCEVGGDKKPMGGGGWRKGMRGC